MLGNCLNKAYKAYQACVACLLVMGLNGCTSQRMMQNYGVYDGRSISNFEKDARIIQSIHNKIIKAAYFREGRLVVHSFNREVLLTGETDKASIRVAIEKIATDTPNVRRVYNEIMLKKPISVVARSKDTWITGYVRSKLVAEKELRSSAIHVVTEAGNVYLMGLVTRQQADLAVNVTRHTPGVIKVIKVFQYVR